MATRYKVLHAGNLTSGLSLSLRERPSINMGRIGGTAKPTSVQLGAYSLFSMPIYSADDEEIFFNWSIPRRWNGSSDIIVGCTAVIDTANDTKKFRLQLSWEHYAVDGVAPATTNDVNFNKTTGNDAQYQSYPVTWTVDYDIDGGGSEIAANEVLGGRIRRIAADDNEIAGEVMLHGFYIQYTTDKIGSTP